MKDNAVCKAYCSCEHQIINSFSFFFKFRNCQLLLQLHAQKCCYSNGAQTYLTPETVEKFEKKIYISQATLHYSAIMAAFISSKQVQVPHRAPRNYFFCTVGQMTPNHPSVKTHSYFFVLAACIEMESSSTKINEKDPTDLGALWIRSIRAGSIPIGNLFVPYAHEVLPQQTSCLLEHLIPCLQAFCSPSPTVCLFNMSCFQVHFSLEHCRWNRVPQLDDVQSPC